MKVTVEMALGAVRAAREQRGMTVKIAFMHPTRCSDAIVDALARVGVEVRFETALDLDAFYLLSDASEIPDAIADLPGYEGTVDTKGDVTFHEQVHGDDWGHQWTPDDDD